ncbi:hypothetical protein RHGRI_014836 [Rhododendron griersonianum]|uniref:Uncharacterized protein n=1 Tax=Rhododendron griersonianum TaxID=479676 RepID=A0AAV6KB03_9ERIC|nr:hypothetical protein RHGRI_014836 [Rhododendron griersonianum]
MGCGWRWSSEAGLPVSRVFGQGTSKSEGDGGWVRTMMMGGWIRPVEYRRQLGRSPITEEVNLQKEVKKKGRKRGRKKGTRTRKS